MPTSLVTLALLAGVAHADDDVVATTASKPSVTIPHEKIELDNGLDVILAEDHSVPFVWVNLWYNVGSKDEQAGRTGFAHLFEHLMFQGSEHYDADYFIPLQAVGARINGTTNFDRTNYFEGVPSEQLPLALWLESDRMGWLLPALTDELKNQQDVVRNERRQRYGTGHGMVWVWLFENLYPESTPTTSPPSGSTRTSRPQPWRTSRPSSRPGTSPTTPRSPSRGTSTRTKPSASWRSTSATSPRGTKRRPFSTSPLPCPRRPSSARRTRSPTQECGWHG